MQRAISTHLLVEHQLTTDWLERIWAAEIPLVELFCARQHLDYRNKAQISDLAYWFRDSQLKVHSLHSPVRWGPEAVINITEPVKSKRLPMVDEIKRALEMAEKIPYRYLIQHLGVEGQEYDGWSVEAAFTALEEISVFARQRGVEVLLENTPNELASAERLLTFLGLTQLDLNVCLDVGHAHMSEGIETAYCLLESRIRSTHVHDNNGKDDLHLFPLLAGGQGTIDWLATMQLLRSQEDRYPLLLELREVPDMGPPFDALRRAFDRLEGLKPNDE